MNKKAQTFTLEGVASALILLVALYTLYQSSLVISPMWNEAVNMQMKMIAQDTLKILDNPKKEGEEYYLDSLQGMITNLRNCQLGVDCKPNDKFMEALEILLSSRGFDYRLELHWVEGDRINSTVLIDKKPSPNAVAASRYILLMKNEILGSSFSGLQLYDPVIFEVRLIVWRP
ncbi:MAG: hypothetical protein QW540_10745 [Archaeoglobaceae archaeon]|uniref:Uncharacterized protein n=1 Tax=Archaeoglobus fulgidus TaxID=2234 RepID=A0A7J3M0V2_ARCFL